MNRRSGTSVALRPAISWLAGALALLLLVLAVGAGAHDEHDHEGGHPDCAACLMCQGSVLADGAIGATVVVFVSCFPAPVQSEARLVAVVDLRLSPGRAPPV
jgi:hypothetical protein